MYSESSAVPKTLEISERGVSLGVARLIFSVRGHHAFKRTCETGSQALALANDAFHGAKLLVVSGQQLGHSIFELCQLDFVVCNALG